MNNRRHQPFISRPADSGQAAPFAPSLSAQRIEVQLSLTIDEQSYAVTGANVTGIELHLTRYGLSGRIEFWMLNNLDYGGTEEDTLFAAFTTSSPIAVELSLTGIREDEEELLEDALPLAVKGLVSERQVYEQPYQGTDKPAVLARHYAATFLDPAALFWTQHDPCELYTDKSIQEVVDLHKGDKIVLAYESEFFSKKRPLIFIGPDPGGRGRDTFYDLVMWLCDHASLHFTYNYKDQSYRIGDEPEDLPAATLLGRLDVQRLMVSYPPVPRYQARVHNAYSEDPRIQPTAVPTGLSPLVRDHLVRTRLGVEFDDRAAVESKRLSVRTPELRLDFGRLPVRMFGPGDCIDLTAAAAWNAAGVAVPAMAGTDTLRVVELRLSLHALDGELRDREIGDIAELSGSCVVLLQAGTEKTPRLPEYITPHYPHLVEGKVVSEQGEEDEETYDIETNSETALRSYKVKLPLFADQIVRAPFLSVPQTGHFYFPIYRNARVLCALSFGEAAVVECLDWRIGAEVPLETQGNQLLMGKKLKSCVAMTMIYDQGVPVFTLRRYHEGEVADSQTVTIKEGLLNILVTETKDNTPSETIRTITVNLDKTSGTTVTVDYPEQKTTQTLLMDGTQILLKVQGENDTSTYTQVADTITIAAKNINVQAETITVNSTKTSTWHADETITMTSTKDFTISTDAALSVTATADGTVKAKNVTITAEQAATCSGADTTVKGSTTLTATAPTTTVEGKTTGTMKGATLEVSASAALTCKSSGTATFKGQLTSIEGSLIKVG